MKKFGWKETLTLVTFSLGYLCLLAKFAHAVDSQNVRQEFDGISFAKYTFEGRPVWDDKERDDIILSHNEELLNVKFSTNSTAKLIDNTDFLVIPDVDSDIALTTTTFKLQLRVNDWFVPVLQKDEVVKFLNDPTQKISNCGCTVKSNGYYLKNPSDAVFIK